MFHQIPPTAGMPLSWKDFYLAFISVCKNRQDIFEEDFKYFFGKKDIFITYSGTAAFYIILESLKQVSKKDTVIIPAYICPLIPLAIVQAGLKVEVCDINCDNYDMDLKKLEDLCNKDTLAVVPTHLGGFPCDMDKINAIAKRTGAFVIEDCAQAMGAEYRDKKVGTLGHFGFFSLCRGKGITIYEGGIIVVNECSYADIIKSTIERLVKNSPFSEMLKIIELAGYKIFYNPSFSWFIFRLPKLYWNMFSNQVKAWGEYFTRDFAVKEVGRFRKAVGHFSFIRLEEALKERHQKADIFKKALKSVNGVTLIKEIDGAKGSYLFFPVVFNDVKRRNRIFNILESKGLGVSNPYLMPITDYDYLKDIVPKTSSINARHMSESSITLSTNTYMRQRDFDNIIEIIKNN